MFNVTVKGNVRCNGLHPSGPGGMVKRNIQSTTTMSPNRGHTITDTKLKFSDRLKAYLSKDGLRSDATELDDPYTFSDSEVKQQQQQLINNVRNNKIEQQRIKLDTLHKKVIKVNNAVIENNHHQHQHHRETNNINNINNIINPSTISIKNNSSGGSGGSSASSDNQTTITGSGKSMSKLQAQIARNKVTVKHNRNSPDLKLDKHFYDKNTKHSIIGLVNNVNSNNNTRNINRRLPSGKPIPAHLRARRVSNKNPIIQQQQPQQQQQLDIQQRIGVQLHNNHLIPSNCPKPSNNKCSPARWHAPQPFGPLSGSRTSITPGKSKIDVSDSDEDEGIGIYQRHWFNKELEVLATEESSRESRLEITRLELKRQLLQMKKSKIGSYRTSPCSSSSSESSSPTSVKNYITSVAQSLVIEGRLRRRKRSPTKPSASGLMLGRNCETDGCARVALPCTKHCVMHIMNNQDQVLFDHCTAKFADNTQCSVPVFDITHELPLCIEHARKRDNYNRMCLETKPKKPRRKIKPSAMIRPQKRNKKRKRSTTNQQPKNTDNSVGLSDTNTTTIATTPPTTTTTAELNVCETSSAYESSEEITLGALSETEFVTINGEDHIGDQDVVEQVLAMQEEVGGDLELVVEQTLVTQASRLLEETDFTNVLNQIPADEFNDLFAVDRNGEYEPSREETEELERALEAVDKDVQSLEKLSATQGLLDSLLDEHTLVESLVQIPDVFHHNGYEVIDDNTTTGTGTTTSPASHTSSSSPRQQQQFHHPAVIIHGVDGMLPVLPPQQAHAHTPS